MSEKKGTKALELWCKRLVKDCPDVQIENMTTSWRNGMAFCALVHHFRPDLIDRSKLKPENVYENNQLAFSTAEKHLGIPALLDPEDMVANEVPDRLSILTYLSQFYQRLGHTVNTKSSGNENTQPSPSPTHSNAPIKFGKTGLDKCAACGLPVYLAQRLIVMHKLYHRRCFRCSKCSSNLNTNNFEFIEGSDFLCDSCKNECTFSKLLNNNDQMGMLAYSDHMPDRADTQVEERTSPTNKAKNSSILEKISMFESAKDTNIHSTLESLSLKDAQINKHKDISTHSLSSTSKAQSAASETETGSKLFFYKESIEATDSEKPKTPEKVYKSNLDKFNFLQTQLSGDTNDCDTDDHDVVCKPKIDYCCGDKEENFNEFNKSITDINKSVTNTSENVLNEDSNVTDDIRIAKSYVPEKKESPLGEDNKHNSQETGVPVPPRKKKLQNSRGMRSESNTEMNLHEDDIKTESKQNNKYPDHLNPFSDDDDDDEEDNLAKREQSKQETTNPFGSSDEEDDDVPPIQPPPAVPTGRDITPVKRLIHANPFWSDDEEPSSEDETSPKKYNSSLATSTPNISSTSRRHKKGRAPPPPTIKVTESLAPATSMDDVASLSSISSFNSTVHSDQKSLGKITPRLNKRMAPTPPDSISTASGAGSMDKGIDTVHRHNNSDGQSRRLKGPAPGLPLPERREVKMQISPEELQEKLDLLETQQLGLERQGVLIEQMIRDKCEGDDSESVPQEEVEDLVIQLCELVNEKNDLFRKQTELMYIRRQQRLEQEQADIEHEIRVIQSQPAVNRCDADKGREEQLVSRLVGVVRLRDELVQQMDAERRRERREDRAIAACIADRRAQRNSESNSSSMKSGEVAVQKKNKVKDKMKKQFKKAKYSLIPKKKSDGEKKEKEQKTEKSPK